MTQCDFITGIHSILCALENPRRKKHHLFATKAALAQLKRQKAFLKNVSITELLPHDLQEEAKKKHLQYNRKYRRITSQIFLLSSPLPTLSLENIHDNLKKRPLKLIALDGMTDQHNMAAITRSAAFFAIDAVIAPHKDFWKGPQFFKMASGALEYVDMIYCSSLARTLDGLQKRGVFCLGLDEQAKDTSLPHLLKQSVCLVVGAEDKGLSHSVKRVLPHLFALPTEGKLSSLNASVAAAIGMDRLFSPKRT